MDALIIENGDGEEASVLGRNLELPRPGCTRVWAAALMSFCASQALTGISETGVDTCFAAQLAGPIASSPQPLRTPHSGERIEDSGEWVNASVETGCEVREAGQSRSARSGLEVRDVSRTADHCYPGARHHRHCGAEYPCPLVSVAGSVCSMFSRIKLF